MPRRYRERLLAGFAADRHLTSSCRKEDSIAVIDGESGRQLSGPAGIGRQITSGPGRAAATARIKTVKLALRAGTSLNCILLAADKVAPVLACAVHHQRRSEPNAWAPARRGTGVADCRSPCMLFKGMISSIFAAEHSLHPRGQRNDSGEKARQFWQDAINHHPAAILPPRRHPMKWGRAQLAWRHLIGATPNRSLRTITITTASVRRSVDFTVHNNRLSGTRRSPSRRLNYAMRARPDQAGASFLAGGSSVDPACAATLHSH